MARSTGSAAKDCACQVPAQACCRVALLSDRLGVHPWLSQRCGHPCCQLLVLALPAKQGAVPAAAWTRTHCSGAATGPSPACRHGYFQALQAREYLPLFWSGAQLALLRGTELEGKVEADR